MPEIVQVPLASLQFDLTNPRLAKEAESQPQAAMRLAEQQGHRLVTLARDIVEMGLDPLTLMAVVPSADARKTYKVVEGNRRLLALKALETPSLVIGALGARDQTALHNLANNFATRPIRLVNCRIEKIARFASRISLTRIDAAELIQSWTTPGGPRTFLYLDPPYYEKGERLYDNFYRHEDHAALAACVHRLQHPWVVSYDAHPEVIRMFNGDRSLKYALSYSAHERQHGSEIMFFSRDLALPDIHSPAGISVRTVQLAVSGRR